MPILFAALTVIIQACFIFHVFKTRRPYWWAFIIFSFPVIGCVVYYFIEIFPGTQEARKAEKLARAIGKHVGGDKEFARRVEEVEICGSVDNKLALARECVQRGLYDDAARLYRSCTQGLYSDDSNLLLGLAGALVEKQDYHEARETLRRLQAKDKDFKSNDAALLRARALDGLGETDAALREYEALIPIYIGLEARYRYAMLLKKVNRSDEARSTFEAMQQHARQHRVTHENEISWLAMAKKEMQG